MMLLLDINEPTASHAVSFNASWTVSSVLRRLVATMLSALTNINGAADIARVYNGYLIENSYSISLVRGFYGRFT